MLLIISNSQDVTSSFLAEILAKRDIPLVRFDTDSLLENSTFEYESLAPLIKINGRAYSPESFNNVWYRRPETLKDSKIAQTPEGKIILDEWVECLEAFFALIPVERWMNHPAKNFAASHKLEQLSTAAKIGFTVPATLVTQDVSQFESFYSQHKGRVIVKPLSAGYVERPSGGSDTIIYTNRVDKGHLEKLTDLAHCPTLIQEFVDKVADVRITIVDREIHAVEMIAKEADGSQRCDIRRNNMDDVAYRLIELPGQIRSMLLGLMDKYQLRFAAIDMAVTSRGDWVFFEINANGQWAWMDLAGASNIAQSFIRSFE